MKCFWIFLWIPLCLTAGTTFQEQANRISNIHGFLLDLRPHYMADQGFSLHGQLAPQPSVDYRIGNKDEPIDPPELVPRLRLAYLSHFGLFFEGTYVPDLSFQDYQADYFAVATGFSFSLKDWQLAVRASFSDGEVQGPITEHLTNDLFVFERRGFDFQAGRSLFRAFKAYGYAGYGDLETDLNVLSDGALWQNKEETFYYGIGLQYHWKKMVFDFQQNFTDTYLSHMVISVGYRF